MPSTQNAQPIVRTTTLYRTIVLPASFYPPGLLGKEEGRIRAGLKPGVPCAEFYGSITARSGTPGNIWSIYHACPSQKGIFDSFTQRGYIIRSDEARIQLHTLRVLIASTNVLCGGRGFFMGNHHPGI